MFLERFSLDVEAFGLGSGIWVASCGRQRESRREALRTTADRVQTSDQFESFGRTAAGQNSCDIGALVTHIDGIDARAARSGIGEPQRERQPSHG
jgi:hypothetical protein